MAKHGNEFGSKSTYAKNVLVTGGAKGLGKAIALEFASQGCNVAINYLSSEKQAMQTLKEIEALGVKGFAFKADVSEEAHVNSLVEKAWSELGSLDFLVNNSGIYAQRPGAPFFELSKKDWDEVFAVNSRGVFLVAKHVALKMIAAKVKGSIVNISSVAGLDYSYAGAHYGASKAAVIALTKNMAADLGPYGIRANSIAPGAVLTDLLKNLPQERKKRLEQSTPLGRFTTPQDIGRAVYALANLENVSGQTLVVDGGRLKH